MSSYGSGNNLLEKPDTDSLMIPRLYEPTKHLHNVLIPEIPTEVKSAGVPKSISQPNMLDTASNHEAKYDVLESQRNQYYSNYKIKNEIRKTRLFVYLLFYLVGFFFSFYSFVASDDDKCSNSIDIWMTVVLIFCMLHALYIVYAMQKTAYQLSKKPNIKWIMLTFIVSSLLWSLAGLYVLLINKSICNINLIFPIPFIFIGSVVGPSFFAYLESVDRTYDDCNDTDDSL